MRYWQFTLLIILIFLSHSCNKKCENKVVTASIDTLSLHDGDLIFREGRSTESQVVTSLDSGSYSHVGIILHTKDGWRVIHAVPNETENELDTVKYESISSFIQPEKCIKAKVIRVSLSDKVVKGAIQYALQKVGMPFDKDFDITDTTTFYCTELVWRAYKHVGIDISKGRRHHINLLGFNKTCILPSDIMPNETNCTLSTLPISQPIFQPLMGAAAVTLVNISADKCSTATHASLLQSSVNINLCLLNTADIADDFIAPACCRADIIDFLLCQHHL